MEVFGEPRDDVDLSPAVDDDVMGTNGGMSLGAGARKPPFGESSPRPGDDPSFLSLAVLDRPFSSPDPDLGVSDLTSFSFCESFFSRGGMMDLLFPESLPILLHV